eukprot:2963433-Prymnesium_polylepis.1
MVPTGHQWRPARTPCGACAGSERHVQLAGFLADTSLGLAWAAAPGPAVAAPFASAPVGDPLSLARSLRSCGVVIMWSAIG